MKNLRNKTWVLFFLLVITSSLLPRLVTAQNSGLQNCTITATGTGRTTGDVVAITITNPAGKEVKDILGPYYIPSDGSYQPYITMEKIPVTVPGGKTVHITLKGFCADITKHAAGEKDNFNPINTWIEIDDTNTGVLTPSQLKINPDTHPELAAPYYFGALESIMKAYDEMKGNGNITTPFSANPEKEREAVIQQSFWIYTAETRQKQYTKEQFRDRTYGQFEDNTKLRITTIPSEQKQSLDNGINNFWNTFEAVGEKAKILDPASILSPVLTSPTAITPSSQLYDFLPAPDVLIIDPDALSVYKNEKSVEPVKNQVEIIGNTIFYIARSETNSDWTFAEGFQVANDGNETLQDVLARYSDVNYAPPDIDCDSLERICKKTAAFNVFWGDIYSVIDQKLESRRVAGETLEKHSEKSLVISRGRKIDCCTGEYSLNLVFQAMHGANDGHSGEKSYNISFSKKLKVGNPCHINCPECKEKCKAEKILEEEILKKMEEARKKWESEH